MKTMHLNKVIAIAQVKLKAFMGKNCIIMPLFSIGFTLLMKYLYSSMSTGASSPEYLNAYVLSMGLVMNLGMCGIYCPSLLLAEEKEKNTLRVLMTSSVNGLEFFIGSILPVFVITVLINFLLIPISGFAMDGGQLAGPLCAGFGHRIADQLYHRNDSGHLCEESGQCGNHYHPGFAAPRHGAYFRRCGGGSVRAIKVCVYGHPDGYDHGHGGRREEGS